MDQPLPAADERTTNTPAERSCPDCHGTLPAPSGCAACPQCGWSRCG